MVELLHIDCMDFMATCKDKQFDLAICDPPYRSDTDQLKRINNFNGSKKSIIKSKATYCKKYDYVSLEENVPKADYFIELRRISKNIIIWGYNYFAEYLGNCRGPIVWDKQTTGYLADAELAYCSIDKNMKIFKFMWNGMLQENMNDKEVRSHPTQKPVQLYKWLLKNYAKPEYKIIDTHLGSGSSAIAAYDFDCDFVGCEIDKEYYEAAKQRFETHKLQQRINF